MDLPVGRSVVKDIKFMCTSIRPVKTCKIRMSALQTSDFMDLLVARRVIKEIKIMRTSMRTYKDV